MADTCDFDMQMEERKLTSPAYEAGRHNTRCCRAAASDKGYVVPDV